MTWKRALLALLLLCIVGGAAFYFRPLEAMRMRSRITLALGGGRKFVTALGPYQVEYYEAKPAQTDGPVIVLIHGLGGSALDWAPVMPALAKAGFHVYALNLLGYGETSHPDIDYSIAKQAAFVNDFIHTIVPCSGPSNAPCRQDIVGWSMGGWIAMRYSLDHPQQVNRLVLDDAAGVNFDPTFPPSVFSPSTPEQATMLMHLLEPSVPKFPPFVMRDYLRMVSRKRDVVSRSVATFETRAEIVDSQLPGLNVPTLVNWGAEDLLIPLDIGRKTAELIPGANLNIFEGCGHLAPARCADRVTPATIAFLNADPAPRGQVQTIAAPARKKTSTAVSSSPK